MGLKHSTQKFEIKRKLIVIDYIILDQIIGKSHSGDILLCKHKKTQKEYALKIMRYENLNEKICVRNAFELQLRACRKSPNDVVNIIDVYENQIDSFKTYFIVMELMQGGRLFDGIVERNAPLTEYYIAKLMSRLCHIVKGLHDANIAHRDLHPNNILFSNKYNDLDVKLTDFFNSIDTKNGLKLPRTEKYASIMIEKAREEEFAHDMFSLGCILYTLCSGNSILEAYNRLYNPSEESLDAIDELETLDVSKKAKILIEGLLEPNYKRRFTINDVLEYEWIKNYCDVPKTPLKTIDVWKNLENKKKIAIDFDRTLNDCRINWSNNVKLKDLKEARNNLLEKRRKKLNTNEQKT